MRLAVWSPLPPSPSGIADYVAETLPALGRGTDLVLVTRDPAEVDPALRERFDVVGPDGVPAVDLDVYHLGNSPAHGFVYRAALRRPGVAVLHDWSLHHLVLCETVERGDLSGYLREMRRSHGERGTFVGRQVARALGGELLPALFPLNDRVLEASLAVVGLTRHVASRAARRLPRRPVLHLPHHVALPLLPAREAARRDLNLPADTLVVTAPGLATSAKRLDAALEAVRRLRPHHPSLRLVIAGAVDPQLPLPSWIEEAGLADVVRVTGRLSLDDFVRHLSAADVLLALRFPSHGEISGALVRALGVGRPVLVTAGTPAAEEFPEGVVVPVDPGPYEEEQLFALLDRLLGDAILRERIGRVAAAHTQRHHDLSGTVATLLGFLEEVLARKEALVRELAEARPPDGLLGYLIDEVQLGARDLGLTGAPLGLEPLLRGLVGGRG
jgi:glycosyltransferase involved in cell wall biosynthesis